MFNELLNAFQLHVFLARQAEQGYSFVDCLSFCLMDERGIREALTKDEHFRQAGFSALLAS